MDEAVDGMQEERQLIFKAFALGLCGNLCTVMAACWVVMSPSNAIVASIIIGYAAMTIYTNSTRIQRKFNVQTEEAVRLDDLTQPQKMKTSDRYSANSSMDRGSFL